MDSAGNAWIPTTRKNLSLKREVRRNRAPLAGLPLQREASSLHSLTPPTPAHTLRLAHMLKRTPFYDFHVSAGAKLVDYAGWEMPLLYRSIVDEHEHTRKNASIFDVS